MATGGDVETEDVFIADDDDDDDDDDSEGWSEMNIESESTLTCLFCPQTFQTIAVALEHCKAEHNFDLMSLKQRFNMDCYSYICLVNYVRREGVMPQQLVGLEVPTWQDMKYLEPTVRDDPWLMFDFEGFELSESRPLSPFSNKGVKVENGVVTMDEEKYKHMRGTIQHLIAVTEQQNASLSRAAEDMAAMRQATQSIVSGINEETLDKGIGKLRITEDHGYFSSYSHFGIHHTMLTDKSRTLSYRDAILKNAEHLAGKVVLDVGCGTGILSMFCAQAGAATVIGVDQSEIIYYAMGIVRENSMEAKVQLIKGRVEEVDLPVDKVDVIVSEWMGYFLLFEGMLDAVILARDKFLKPGGLMLPSRCTMTLVGISDPECYQDNVEFWSDVYGYKMTSLRKEVVKEAFITQVPIDAIVTTPALVHSLDLATCNIESSTFTSQFSFTCNKDGLITAICGYFDCLFELPHSVTLSTSPFAEKTHWRQTVFFLPQPLAVTSGRTITGSIKCDKKPEYPRALVIELRIEEKTLTYILA